VEDNGTLGCPIATCSRMLVGKVRTATPKELYWEPTDGVVRDHTGCASVSQKKGQRLEARLDAAEARGDHEGGRGSRGMARCALLRSDEGTHSSRSMVGAVRVAGEAPRRFACARVCVWHATI
jgi:hypothetical protein